jgi:hypothetical protein
MLSVSPHTVAMTVLVKQYVTGVDLEMPTRQELGLFLAAIMQDSELELRARNYDTSLPRGPGAGHRPVQYS